MKKSKNFAFDHSRLDEVMKQLNEDNKVILALAERINKGLSKNKVEDQVEALLDDANYTRRVLKATGCYTATYVAKELGMRSAKALNEELHSVGIICKENDGSWYLQAKYINYGLESTETRTYHGITKKTMLWTEKGRRWLHALAERGLIQTAPKPVKKEKKGEKVIVKAATVTDLEKLIRETQEAFLSLILVSKACMLKKPKKSLVREVRDTNDKTAMLMRKLESECYKTLA